jgi:hypothetical protein
MNLVVRFDVVLERGGKEGICESELPTKKL